MKNKSKFLKFIICTILLTCVFNFGIFNNFSYGESLVEKAKKAAEKAASDKSTSSGTSSSTPKGDVSEMVKNAKEEKEKVDSYLTDPTVNPDAYKPDEPTSTTIGSFAGEFVAVLRNISVIISVIYVMILGVRYIFGSLEERADYKKTMIPIAIGMGFITLILTIVVYLHDVFKGIFG